MLYFTLMFGPESFAFVLFIIFCRKSFVNNIYCVYRGLGVLMYGTHTTEKTTTANKKRNVEKKRQMVGLDRWMYTRYGKCIKYLQKKREIYSIFVREGDSGRML